MAELHEFTAEEPQVQAMNLYCWPCRTVHQFPLADVEKLVYALGADAQDGWSETAVVSMDEPDCLNELLKAAGNPEAYAEHVEQGIECREAAE
jgi:hypothetical protein